MIIGIWIIVCTCVVVILGEIKYRYVDQREKVRESKAVSKDWKDNMDADLDRLFIEHPNNEFVSSQALAMRGSWRLAQNQVMEREIFSVLCEEEYAKKL